LPGLVQANGDLLDLVGGECTRAPEAEKHDAALWLSIEPGEALMPPLCFLTIPLAAPD